MIIKSSTDCLNGISKLDYLVKVSVFQLYKDDDLNTQRKFSVATASTVDNGDFIQDATNNILGTMVKNDERLSA